MSDNVTLDVAFCRSFFPALDPGWAYFENAGGTLVPRTVSDRVAAYMRAGGAQPGADFSASGLATEGITAGRRALAALIGAGADEIVVGPSTTSNVFVLAHALRPWFAAGDEIVVTNQDHEANNGAWRRLADAGLTIREWRMNLETAELEIEDLDALLNERTRLVCFTACSNIVGTVYDAEAIVDRVHEAGALACVDAVALTPHRKVDVKDIDADFLLFSAYKAFGPHIAVLYGKADLLARAENQNHYFVAGDPALKLAPGGPNHELTAGAAGITDYFEAVFAHHFAGEDADLGQRLRRVYDLVADHEARLAAPLASFLAARPDVRLFGRAAGDAVRRVPVFSFVIDGRDSRDVAARLQAQGMTARAGDFYAARCIDDLGARPQNGVVRASMAHTNTLDEVDRLIRHLDTVI